MIGYLIEKQFRLLLLLVLQCLDRGTLIQRLLRDVVIVQVRIACEQGFQVIAGSTVGGVEDIVRPLKRSTLPLVCGHRVLAQVVDGKGLADLAASLMMTEHVEPPTVHPWTRCRGAEQMVTACLGVQGNCLHALGRLNDAADTYQEAIRHGEQCGAEQAIAGSQGQLGTVRLEQHRYPEALAAYQDARERFTRLRDPGSVAGFWFQTGKVYLASDQPESAEAAYRKSLAIRVRLGDDAGQADTLGQLGTLCFSVLDRPEHAVVFYRQATEK